MYIHVYMISADVASVNLNVSQKSFSIKKLYVHNVQQKTFNTPSE